MRFMDATFNFPIAKTGRPTAKSLSRAAAAIALLVALAYCVQTAWAVLGDLSTVKLADFKRALDVVSVRDAVLCIIGYRLATELVRAVIRPRPE